MCRKAGVLTFNERERVCVYVQTRLVGVDRRVDRKDFFHESMEFYGSILEKAGMSD
jgi:hypothetical protein